MLRKLAGLLGLWLFLLVLALSTGWNAVWVLVYSLGLQDAIELGALTPYDYHPVVVELRGHELDDYLEITSQIIMRLAQTGADVGDGDDPVER